MTAAAPAAVEPRDEARVAADLVRRIQAGDAEAEGAIFERYSRGLLCFLRRRTGDPALAEDLHQETFGIVLTRLRETGLGEPEKLAAFLHRTANNLIIADYRKAVRRRTENDPEAGAGGEPPGQLDRVLRRERSALVRRLLSELEPPRDGELLFRFYIAEQEKEQVCAELAISEDHFKRVLYRARRRFKQLLEGARKRRRMAGAAAAMRTHPSDQEAEHAGR